MPDRSAPNATAGVPIATSERTRSGASSARNMPSIPLRVSDDVGRGEGELVEDAREDGDEPLAQVDSAEVDAAGLPVSRHFDHDQSAAVEPAQQRCPMGRPEAEAMQEDDGVLPVADLESPQVDRGFGELDTSVSGPEPVAGEGGCFGIFKRGTRRGDASVNGHRHS
jgi:hypothetical protein